MLPSMESVLAEILAVDTAREIKSLWFLQGVKSEEGISSLLGFTLEVGDIDVAIALQFLQRGVVQVITPVAPLPGRIYFQVVCQPVDDEAIYDALLKSGFEYVERSPRGPYFRYPVAAEVGQ